MARCIIWATIGGIMALAKCRECGKDVSTESAHCPHCGVVDPTGAAATKEKAERATYQKAAGGCCLVVVAMVVILGIAISRSSSTNSAASHEDDLRNWARVACENAVEAQMLSPSGADFQRPANFARVGGDSAVVAGTVDAPNAFGAKIRTSFTCILHYTGGNDWTPIAVDVRSPRIE